MKTLNKIVLVCLITISIGIFISCNDKVKDTEETEFVDSISIKEELAATEIDTITVNK